MPNPSPGQRVVKLAWTAPDPNTGVTGYYIWFGLYKWITATGGGTYWVQDKAYRVDGVNNVTANVPLPDAQQYGFSVVARDAAGNESSGTNTVFDPPITASPSPAAALKIIK